MYVFFYVAILSTGMTVIVICEISLQRIIFEYNAFLASAKSASTFVKRLKSDTDYNILSCTHACTKSMVEKYKFLFYCSKF